VVYLADHASSALLERLLHVDRDVLPSIFQLLRIQVPSATPVDVTDVAALPIDWRDRQDLTQQLGDQWLKGCSGVLLRVPSAITPKASNYLMNPAHAAAAAVSIAETIIAPFDPRLWGR
jgi:RES domain-containing protein